MRAQFLLEQGAAEVPVNDVDPFMHECGDSGRCTFVWCGISQLTPKAFLTSSGEGGSFGQWGWVLTPGPPPPSHDRLSPYGKMGTVPSSLPSPLVPLSGNKDAFACAHHKETILSGSDFLLLSFLG